MKVHVSRGGEREEQEKKEFMKSFSEQPTALRIQYCTNVGKSLLTNLLVSLSDDIFKSYDKRIDLINITDNIMKEINIQLFVESNVKRDEKISLLGNMIYNEILRICTYLKTLYSADRINYNRFINSFDKNEIAAQIIDLLS